MCFVELTKEFLMIYDKSPSRLQKKITEPIKMQVWILVVCMWAVVGLYGEETDL